MEPIEELTHGWLSLPWIGDFCAGEVHVGDIARNDDEIVGERNGNDLRVKWRARTAGGIGLCHYLAPFLGGAHVEGEYAVSIFLDDVALKPFCQRLSSWVFWIELADAVEDLGNRYGRYKEIVAVEMALKPRYHCWIWLLFSQFA